MKLDNEEDKEIVFLLANQQLIPADLRGKRLVSGKITKRRSDNRLGVNYIWWDYDKWLLAFEWLPEDFVSLEGR